MLEFEQFRAQLIEECGKRFDTIMKKELSGLSEEERARIGLSDESLAMILELNGRITADTLSYALTRYHEWAQVFSVDSYEDIR